MSRDKLTLHGRNALAAQSVVDNALCVTMIKASDDREATMRLLMERRNRWRTWQTVKQREFQQWTRRPQRARHHDSVAIREEYVRC